MDINLGNYLMVVGDCEQDITDPRYRIPAETALRWAVFDALFEFYTEGNVLKVKWRE